MLGYGLGVFVVFGLLMAGTEVLGLGSDLAEDCLLSVSVVVSISGLVVSLAERRLRAAWRALAERVAAASIMAANFVRVFRRTMSTGRSLLSYM